MKENQPIDQAALNKEIEIFGTKFAVQKLFYELGMCGVKTILLPSGTPQENIEQTLERLDIGTRGVTVRFSFEKALNLPRGFFRNKQECLQFILSQKPEYSVIVQEYTNLEHSFELYADAKSTYLQVMPGIWEVSTNAQPDIMRKTGNKLTVWRYIKPRASKFTNKDGEFYIEERKPLEFDRLYGYFEQLGQYQDRLDLLREVFNPLCCHFYENDKGIFSFLNVRNFGEFPINDESPTYFHTVNGLDDIHNWDGKKPVLFNARAERHNDKPLVIAIQHLVNKGVKKVYVNYGILSHPAILLREAGIQVEQSYTLYERKDFEVK